MRENPLTESITPTRPTPYSKHPWQIVECLETGMVYLANPPDYSSLVDQYAWEKTYATEKASRRKREPIISFLSDCVKATRRTLRPQEKIVSLSVKILQHLRTVSSEESLTLVDGGCGIADKTVSIAAEATTRHHIKVTPIGIEISSAQAREADAALSPYGGRCIQGSAIEGFVELPDRSVDLIILCSFLEHEVNPLPLLRECNRTLKLHGRVIIKVPNYNSFNRRIRQKRWCGFRYPDHVNYFTPQTLKDIIRTSGLDVVRMNFFDRPPTSDNMWVIAGHNASE